MEFLGRSINQIINEVQNDLMDAQRYATTPMYRRGDVVHVPITEPVSVQEYGVGEYLSWPQMTEERITLDSDIFSVEQLRAAIERLRNMELLSPSRDWTGLDRYWESTRRLPKALDSITDSISIGIGESTPERGTGSKKKTAKG